MLIILSMTLTLVPAMAKKNVNSILFDFETYEGTWSGTDKYTAPKGDSVGSFSAYGGTSEVHGIEAGAPANSPYGVSIKETHKPDPGENALKKYAGVLYTFGNNYKINDTLHVKFSYYADTNTENNKQAPRMLRLWGPATEGAGASAVIPISFNGGNGGGSVTTHGVTLATWKTDTWYDVDLTYNMHTGEYTTTVVGKDGTNATKSGVTTSTMFTINRLEFFTSYTSTKLKTDGYGTQVYYWDNIQVNDDWAFHLPKSEGADTTRLGDLFDFENSELTAEGSVAPKKYTGASGSTFEMSIDDTYQYGVTPYIVKESETSDNKMLKLVSLPNQTYSQLSYYPKKTVDDTIYIKATVRIDENLGCFNIYAHNYLWCVMNIRTGYVHVLGDNTEKNRLIPYEIGKPFDVEFKLDMDSGYYEATATDGTNTATKTGYYYQDLTSSITYKDVTHSKMLFRFVGKADNTKSSVVTIDNIQCGNLPEMHHNVSVNNNLSSSIPGYMAGIQKKGILTNGTAGVFRFPFKSKAFDFSVDISMPDLNTTRTIGAWSSNSTTASSYVTEDLLTIGTDGYIKAAGSDEALNAEPITAGVYTLEADYIYSAKELRMNLKNKDTGAVVASKNMKITNVLSGISILPAAATEDVTSETTVANFSVATKDINAFGIDTANSTTGKGKIVYEDDEVLVKFTNPVDQTLFSKENIKFPYASISEYEYEFVNPTTVRIYFDKVSGTHYHIALNDVTDVYGTPVSDYIEFDVVRKDFEMSGVRFTNSSGEVLSLLESGNITASFKASANNGTTKNIFFAIAQYEDNTLTKLVSDEFVVDGKDQTVSLTTEVDESYSGDLVAFVWEAGNAKPLWKKYVLKSQTDKPVVILKLDDLNHGSDRLEQFDTVLAILEERGIKAGYGLMGYALDGGSASANEKIKAYADNPLIEVWSHGYHWESKYLFSSMDEAGQRDEFKLSVDSAAREGITLESFGAPSNAINKTTLELMDNEFTNFKVLMRPSNKSLETEFGYTPKNFIYLNDTLQVEFSSVIGPLETLKANWDSAVASGKDYVMIQSHPWCWGVTCSDGNTGYQNMEAFIDYVIEQGGVFMTPSEYAEYITK